MADVNYSVVDFDNLSAVSDGKTLLYTDGQVCKSKNNLSELIQSAVDKQVENKLDTTAFSTVSGNFLTAHQSLDGYATTSELNTASSTLVDKIDYVSGQVDNKLDTTAAAEIYQPKGDYLTANALDEVSGTWNTVIDKANTSDVEELSGKMETITGDLNTISGQVEDVSGTLNDKLDTTVAAETYLTQLDASTAYQSKGNYLSANALNGYATETWVNEQGYLTEHQQIPESANWNESYETVNANSAAWSNGAFVTAALTPGENPVPDVPEPTNKVIYLTKEEGSSKTDPYTEWIYSDKWEIIGETTVDLSDYYPMSATSGASEISAALDLKEDKVFVAEFNVTPYADIKAAYDAGKKIVCKYNPLPQQFPDLSIFAYVSLPSACE